MNQQVCSNIVDLNKPEPKPETTALATIPSTEPILNPELMQSQPEIDPRKTVKVSTVADAYFSVADSILLKNLFESIHVLCDEVVFQFEPDALIIRLMDPSRVAMLDYKIEKQYFEEWEVRKPGYWVFNIAEVLKIVFAKIKKDTTIKIAADPITDHLIFTMKDSRTRTRDFPLLNTDEVPESPPKPQLSLHALAKVVSKEWKEDLQDLQKCTDHVQIHIASEGVKVKAQGDLVKAENKYERGSGMLLNVEAREYSVATFSLSYLVDLIDPKLCDIATLELSTDMPIRLTMHTPYGDLYTYLAPRIETD